MFVSYAQNFEDVILWRALKHVKNGFYIDIGAQDPIVESVSRSFYENGWRGIHVEPTTYYAQKIRENRPDEITIQAAIGHGGDKIAFYEVPETGLSTGDVKIAEGHRRSGFRIIETSVPLLSLSELFVQAGMQDIHWLKIDVEGMEQSVIESWGTSPAEPWIVVVESTLPNSQVPSHKGWEPLLLQRGYRYVYFDGLSRYYVSKKHKELANVFGPGPNFFDHFRLSTLVELEQQQGIFRDRIDALENQQKVLQDQIFFLRFERDAAVALSEEGRRQTREIVALSDQRAQELQKIYESSSWRVTGPLRALGRVRDRGKTYVKGRIRPFLEYAHLYVKRRPRLKSFLLQYLGMFPYLRNRALRFVENRMEKPRQEMPQLPEISIEPDPAAVFAWFKVLSEDKK